MTVEILKAIRDEIRSTNSRLDGVRGELHDLRGDFQELRDDVRQLRADTSTGLARHEVAIGKLVQEVQSLNGRFDNFLTGAHQKAHEEQRRLYDDLEGRVSVLEAERRRPG